MAKKRTNRYWIERSNQILAGVHKESDGYIQLINKSYDKALKDTQTDINKIFATYVREHNLTPPEARKFLNTKISTKEISHLRQKLDQVTNEEIKKSLLAEINANAYKARITRLEALKQSINVNYKVAADKELTLSKRVYIDTIEESYYRTAFNLQKGIDISFNLAQIPTKTIDVILNTKWSGKLYKKRIWGNNQVTIDKISNTITSGFISGKSIPKMVKEIEGLTEYGKYAAERLIRTECTYFSNQGSMESYRECDVEKYIFVATLDLRTSKQCREHDRKVYEVSKAMPGKNLPPLHVFCRSTTRAYLGEEYMNNIKRRARDPETGKTYLVGNMNYEEWYNQYVKGNPRAELTEQKINNMSADKKQYEKYRNILGKEAPKSIDAFQDLKYTDSKKWNLLKDFVDSKGSGRIARDATLKQWEDIVKEANEKLVGINTPNGIKISELSHHGVERFIGDGENRIGVLVEDVKNALLTPLEIKDIKIDALARKSQKFIGENATISINTDTGNIIQTNPTSTKLAERLKRRLKGD